MIAITPTLSLQEDEISYKFICSPGPGGQNVNKTASAVLLRFNVLHSTSLTDDIRERLIQVLGRKLSSQGDLIIKAFRFRTQERNKQDALQRLCELLQHAARPIKKRKKTKPTKASNEKRLQKKKLTSKAKSLRRSAIDTD